MELVVERGLSDDEKVEEVADEEALMATVGEMDDAGGAAAEGGGAAAGDGDGGEGEGKGPRFRMDAVVVAIETAATRAESAVGSMALRDAMNDLTALHDALREALDHDK